MKKKSLMKDKRNNEVQRPHTRRNHKRHISLVSLFLWRKMVAIHCFVWALGLQLWSASEWVSETEFQVLAIFIKTQYPAGSKRFHVVNAVFHVRWTNITASERKMFLGWFLKVAFLAACEASGAIPTWTLLPYSLIHIGYWNIAYWCTSHKMIWNLSWLKILQFVCTCMWINSIVFVGVWSSHSRYWELHSDTGISLLQLAPSWRYANTALIIVATKLLLGATLGDEVKKSIIDILKGVETLSTIIITNGCNWYVCQCVWCGRVPYTVVLSG